MPDISIDIEYVAPLPENESAAQITHQTSMSLNVNPETDSFAVNTMSYVALLPTVDRSGVMVIVGPVRSTTTVSGTDELDVRPSNVAIAVIERVPSETPVIEHSKRPLTSVIQGDPVTRLLTLN